MNVLKLVRPLIFATLIAVLLFFAAGLIFQPKPPENPGATLHLIAPDFAHAVKAQSGSDISAKLDAEAGISAYYKSPLPISLSQVKPVFRTIESETGDYMIGSVPINSYPEHFDVHVYVHKDGWILAYYLKDQPASKMIDQVGKTITTTKLEKAMTSIAGAAGVPLTGVTYYDFRYPNAKYILLVAEDTNNGADFTINLPSTYAYFERGWAVGSPSCGNNVNIKVDGNYMDLTWQGDGVFYGTISSSQLLPDTQHTVEVHPCFSSYYAYGVMVITYWKP